MKLPLKVALSAMPYGAYSLPANSTTTVSAVLTGGAKVWCSGAGTLVLSSANTHTGGNEVVGGTLRLDNASAGGTGTFYVGPSGTLNINVGNTTFSNNVQGEGAITIPNLGSGASSLSLTGDWSKHSGPISLGTGGGKVAFGSASVMPKGPISVLSGATLYVSNGQTYANALSLAGGATGESLGQLRLESNTTWSGPITLLAATEIGGNTSNATISGPISGSFGWTKRGSGTLVLSGANTYTGATTINAGTVSFSGATALNNVRTSVTVASGTTLKWDATGIGGTANSDTMGASVGVSGANTTISGAGTLTVAGNTTDFLGLGNTSGRTVTFSMSAGSLINITGGSLRNGGYSGGVWTSNLSGLTVASGALFDVWDGNTVNVDALNGAGGVTNQSNSAGDRVVSVGVNNGSGTFSGVIGGGTRAGANHIAITKKGTGTQILSGANTYVGATTVNVGELQVNGSLSASSAVSVSGGTLAGTGTVGAVTVANVASSKIRGGTGAGNAGTLSCSALTFSGSTAALDVTTNGTALSLVAATGAVALGACTVNLTAAMPAGTFNLITAGTMTGTLPTIGTNSSGRTPTLSQVGNNLQLVLV